MTENTETFDIIIPQIDLPSPEVVGAKFKESFDGVIGKVDAQIAALKSDPNTKEGRAERKSLAYKISQTKVAMDKRASELIAPQKKVSKAVDQERAVMKAELDKRRDAVRAPVTEWEEAEKARKAKSDTAFEFLYNWKSYELNGKPIEDMASNEVHGFMKSVEALLPASEELFGDDLDDYEALVYKTVAELKDRVEALKSKERDQEELAQLRAEREKREQAEAKAKAEKAEADRIAAQKAELAKEAEAKAKREADEAIEAERRKTAEAERKIKEAEAARIAAEAETKERERLAAEKAEADKKAALEAQRKRAEDEALAKAEQDRRNAADLANRKEVHGEIVSDLVKYADISEAQANRIIQALDDGKVRRISIQY